jgi:hypothetical protein
MGVLCSANDFRPRTPGGSERNNGGHAKGPQPFESYNRLEFLLWRQPIPSALRRSLEIFRTCADSFCFLSDKPRTKLLGSYATRRKGMLL